MVSVDLMSLWNPVCSVLLCYSVRNRTDSRYEMRRMWLTGEFFLSWKIFFFLTEDILFSHRTHRFNRPHLRTVSNSQNASGIQISQNVTAKDRCWMLSVRCWWLAKEASERINIPIKTQAAKEGYLGDHSLLHSERGWGEASLGCNALCYRLT